MAVHRAQPDRPVSGERPGVWHRLGLGSLVQPRTPQSASLPFSPAPVCPPPNLSCPAHTPKPTFPSTHPARNSNTAMAMCGLVKPVFRLPYVPLSREQREQGKKILDAIKQHLPGVEVGMQHV